MTLSVCKAKHSELEKRIKRMPEGKINKCTKKGHVYYYLRDGDKVKYVKKDDPIIQQVIQKEYFTLLKKETEEEIKIVGTAIKRLNTLYSKKHSRFSLYKRKQVKEFRMVEVLGEEWKKTNRRDEEHIYETDKGDYVRSKAEVIIANLLNKTAPYIYEKRMSLNGYTVYPDFYILNTRTGQIVIMEHLGKMGDEGYAARNIRKINDYIKAGFLPGKNLIITMETKDAPLDVEVMKKLVMQCCT